MEKSTNAKGSLLVAVQTSCRKDGNDRGIVCSYGLRQLFGVAADCMIGLLWIYSGSIHLYNPFAFYESIEGYQFGLPVVSTVVASYLPWLQITLGVCLVSGVLLWVARIASLALLQALAFVQIFVYIRGIETSCGCFGDFSSTISISSIMIAEGLVTISLLQLVNTVLSGIPRKEATQP